MKKQTYKIISIIACAASLIFSSCSFNKNTESNEKTETANGTASITVSASISKNFFGTERKLVAEDEDIKLYTNNFLTVNLTGYLNYDADSGTHDETKSKDWTPGYVSIEDDSEIKDLTPGNWTFFLKAYKESNENLNYLESEAVTVTLAAGTNTPINFILIPQQDKSISYDTLISVKDYSNSGYNGAVLYVYDYDTFANGNEAENIPSMSIEGKTPLNICYCVNNNQNPYEYKLVAKNLENKKYWVVGKLVKFKSTAETDIMQDEVFNEANIDTTYIKPHTFCTEQVTGILSSFMDNSYVVGSYKVTLQLGTYEECEYDGETLGYSDVELEYKTCEPLYLREPKINGYIFDGWYLQKTGTGSSETYSKKLTKTIADSKTAYIFNNTCTLAGDKNVYPKWIPATEIIYHINGKTITQIVDANLDEFELLKPNDLAQKYNMNGITDANFTGWYMTDSYASAQSPADNLVWEKLYSENLQTGAVELYGFYSNVCSLTGISFTDYKDENKNINVQNAVSEAYVNILKTNEKTYLDKAFTDGDSITVTFNFTSNKAISFVPVFVYKTSNDRIARITAEDFDAENPLQVEANKTSTFTKTFSFENEEYGPDETVLAPGAEKYIILHNATYTDSGDSLTSAFSTDTIIHCDFTDISVGGTSKLVLWKSVEENTPDSYELLYLDLLYDDGDNYMLPDYGPDKTLHRDVLKIPIKSEDPDSSIYNYYVEGFTFLGWYDNPDYKGEPITAISNSDTAAKAYYAKWGIEVNKVGSEFNVNIPFDKILPSFTFSTYKRLYINMYLSEDYEKLDEVELVDSSGNKQHPVNYNNDEPFTDPFDFTIKKMEDISVSDSNNTFNIMSYSQVINNYNTYKVPDNTYLRLIFQDNEEVESFIISDWSFGYDIKGDEPKELNKLTSNSYLLYSKNTDWSDKSKTGTYIGYTKSYPLKETRSDTTFISQEKYEDTGIDYVADDAGNYYVIYGNQVDKNGEVLFTWNDPEIKLSMLYYDTSTGYLFAAGDRGDGTSDFCRYDFTNEEAVYGSFKCRFDGDSSNYKLADFATYSQGQWQNYMFLNFVTQKAYIDDPSKQYVVTVGYNVFEKENKKVLEIQIFPPWSTYKPITSYAELFGTKEYSYVKINDMQVVNLGTARTPNPYLYVLFGCFDVKSLAPNNYDVYSYGFVSRITFSESGSVDPASYGVRWDTSFGTNGMFGYNMYGDVEGETVYTLNNDEDGINLKFYKSVSSSSDLNKYFVNPQKFVISQTKINGVPAKKLIFSDDGMFIWYDGDYHSARNVNRVVTLDLEALTFTSEYVENVNLDETYNLNISTSNFNSYRIGDNYNGESFGN